MTVYESHFFFQNCYFKIIHVKVYCNKSSPSFFTGIKNLKSALLFVTGLVYTLQGEIVFSQNLINVFIKKNISLKKCINLLICFTWRQITIMFIKSQWNTGTTFRYIMDFQLIISEHFVAVLMYLLKYSSLQKCINLLINFI